MPNFKVNELVQVWGEGSDIFRIKDIETREGYTCVYLQRRSHFCEDCGSEKWEGHGWEGIGKLREII